MQFPAQAIITIMALAIPLASAQDCKICPGSNGALLAADGGNGKAPSIFKWACGVEYWTATNVGSSREQDATACAAACARYNAGITGGPACWAGSFDTFASATAANCFLKPSLNNVQPSPRSNVLTTLLQGSLVSA